MFTQLFLPLGGLIALTVWLAIRHVVAVTQAQRQMRIVRCGASVQGKVVAIQRPFMLDACTRLYFDFVPVGGQQPLRACHVDRRSPEELRASLPAAGSLVSVRYLPDQPKQAVISRLVAAE